MSEQEEKEIPIDPKLLDYDKEVDSSAQLPPTNQALSIQPALASNPFQSFRTHQHDYAPSTQQEIPRQQPVDSRNQPQSHLDQPAHLQQFSSYQPRLQHHELSPRSQFARLRPSQDSENSHQQQGFSHYQATPSGYEHNQPHYQRDQPVPVQQQPLHQSHLYHHQLPPRLQFASLRHSQDDQDDQDSHQQQGFLHYQAIPSSELSLSADTRDYLRQSIHRHELPTPARVVEPAPNFDQMMHGSININNTPSTQPRAAAATPAQQNTRGVRGVPRRERAAQHDRSPTPTERATGASQRDRSSSSGSSGPAFGGRIPPHVARARYLLPGEVPLEPVEGRVNQPNDRRASRASRPRRGAVAPAKQRARKQTVHSQGRRQPRPAGPPLPPPSPYVPRILDASPYRDEFTCDLCPVDQPGGPARFGWRDHLQQHKADVHRRYEAPYDVDQVPLPRRYAPGSKSIKHRTAMRHWLGAGRSTTPCLPCVDRDRRCIVSPSASRCIECIVSDNGSYCGAAGVKFVLMNERYRDEERYKGKYGGRGKKDEEDEGKGEGKGKGKGKKRKREDDE
ncbi:hypothetical protein ACLMJK_004340 [Lecanora helva]